MPNLVNIRTWAEALESGKYYQARESFYDKAWGHGHTGRRAGRVPEPAKYCCLAVAAELSGVDVPNVGMEFDERLPPATREWLGLAEDEDNPGLNLGPSGWESATEANDELKLTFPEIAKAIRRTWLGERFDGDTP